MTFGNRAVKHGSRFSLCALVAVFTLLAISGCNNPFSLVGLLDGTTGEPLSITPAAVVINVNEIITFQAEGGSPPYRFELAQGDGVLDEATGQYTAPGTTGTVVVQVVDSFAVASAASVVVKDGSGPGALTISPSAISVYTNQSISFTGSGGTPPYQFSVVTAGSGSPSVDLNTGVYTSGGSPGTDTIEIRDSAVPQNSTTATVSVSLPSSDVDYAVSSVTNTGGTTGGAALSGEFVFLNTGATDGGLTVTWKAYVSIDSLLDGGDILVDSATTTPLTSGATSAAIPFSGTWPIYDRTYFLIVTVSAADDTAPGNNVLVSVPLAVTGSPPPNIDYVVTTVTKANSPATVGSTINETFSIQNSGSDHGASDVFWTAYISTDTLLDGGDTTFDSGTAAALVAGASATGIALAGNWPSIPGTYYLIVTVTASDEGTTSNNDTPSLGFVLNPPNVDYVVTAVTRTASVTTGDSIGEAFDLQNQGADAGAQTVYWNAYISTDTALDKPGDTLVDSGTTTELGAGATTVGIPVGGTYPAVAGTRYLIVEVSSSDETVTGNNYTESLSISINDPDVDYSVTSISAPPGTAVGGEAISETFTFTNNGAYNGSAAVYWTAYASTDGTLGGGGESVIDSGSTRALNSGATSGAISFGGSWPTSPDTYYLIINVSASDDVNSANNWNASGTTTDVSGIASDVDYTVATVANTGGTTGGGALSGQFTFTNGGTTDGTQTVTWEAYVSTDTTLGGGDVLVDSGPAGALGAGATSGTIGFTGSWPPVDDTYYLIVSLDASDDGVVTNNTGASSAVSVTGSPGPDIDYIVTSVTRTNTPAATGSTISESFDLQNGGTTNGSELVFWTAYVSTDTTLDGGDSVVDTGSESALNAGVTSTSIPISGTWPLVPSTYYLIIDVTAGDDGTPGNNDTASLGFTITGPNVDYVVTNVTRVNTPAATGSAISESFELQNSGTTNGSELVYWTAYVSTDATLDGSDIIADTGSVSALNAGATNTGIPIAGTWPATPNTYYLIVDATSGDDVAPGNNTTASPAFTITGPSVDYVVTSVTNGNTPAAAASPISESFVIQNQGSTAGSATVSWTAYISTNTVVDAGDSIADSGTTGALGSGASSGSLAIGGNWPATPGTYYLVVEVEATDEGTTGNNQSASGSFNITGSTVIDYTVLSVSSSIPSVVAGTGIAETFDVKNIGDTMGAVAIDWEAYLSTNTTYDGGDTLINSGTIGAIAPGVTQSGISIGGTWSTEGTYYLIVRVSASDETVSGWDNNFSGPFTVSYPPDYSIVSANVPIVNWGGNINEAMSSTASAPDDIQSFSIYNDAAAGDGVSNVTWSAYLSTDTVVGGDQLLGTNTIAGFGAGTTQGPFIFGNDDFLPATPGWYYILIEVSAGDDSNTGNNLYISAPVAVWQTTNIETDTTDDSIATADDYAVILNPDAPNDTLTVSGTIDTNWTSSDYFEIKTGPSTTNLDIRATWSTNNNTLRLYLHDSVGLQIGASEATTKDAQPGASPWTVTGLSPNSVYYVEVFVYFDGYGGQPYTLTVTGY